MSQNMKDVKEITIPQGSVKKIEDSNGNTIWGSQSAFPYRRLEYITSNGTQALDTGVKCGRNSYMKIVFMDTAGLDSNQQGRGAVANNQRFACGSNNGTVFFGLGNAWITRVEQTLNIKRTVGVQGPECNVLNNQIGTSNKKQGYLIDSTFTENTHTFPSGITWYSVYLFGSRGNTSGSIQNPLSCRLYYTELGYTSGTARNYNKRYYPVQRKSDGKLGLYDTISNTFLSELVSGSDANSLAAGPVADEYWDMTDVTIN